MALGANSSNVLTLVLRQAMITALIGVLIGLAGSLILMRFMQSMLYEISTFDPLTFTTVALLLLGVALIASYLPALRATRVDPIVALRYQ
jgi:putative ABC transport system permease protein